MGLVKYQFGGPGVSSTTTTTTPNTTSGVVQATLASTSSPVTTPFSSVSTTPNYVYTSPTPTGTSVSKSTGSGSPGVIAGVAVGAAVGASLLTLILTILFMRRHKQRPRSSHHLEKSRRSDLVGGGGGRPSKGPLIVVNEVQDQPRNAWEKFLPQSADDGSIRLSVKTLFNQIEIHVENYYRDSPVQVTQQMQAGLAQVDSPNLPQSVVALLPRARAPRTIIKHCLANLILSHIVADGNSANTFLPAAFLSLPESLEPSSNNSDKPGKQVSAVLPPEFTNGYTVYNQALSAWRQLTSYLRPRAAADPLYVSRRDEAIRLAADSFCEAFAPWASRQDTYGPRKQNVMEIMKSAAETGILLFSQPCAFGYQWRGSGGDSTGEERIVVTPALVKKADENGKVFEKGTELELVQATVAAI
jgi:hypothetical protein